MSLLVARLLPECRRSLRSTRDEDGRSGDREESRERLCGEDRKRSSSRREEEWESYLEVDGNGPGFKLCSLEVTLKTGETILYEEQSAATVFGVCRLTFDTAGVCSKGQRAKKSVGFPFPTTITQLIHLVLAYSWQPFV